MCVVCFSYSDVGSVSETGSVIAVIERTNRDLISFVDKGVHSVLRRADALYPGGADGGELGAVMLPFAARSTHGRYRTT